MTDPNQGSPSANSLDETPGGDAAPKVPPVQEPAADATTALGMDSPARRTGGHDLAPAMASPRKGMPLGLILGIAAGLILLGALGAWKAGLFTQGTEVEKPVSAAPAIPEAEVPPALRTYLRDAQNGDAKAMRMLGVMYYNGLNCPQNREEGRRWFTRAAEAGSEAARKDLEQLGLPVPPRKP